MASKAKGEGPEGWGAVFRSQGRSSGPINNTYTYSYKWHQYIHIYIQMASQAKGDGAEGWGTIFRS